jgi:hypothetical protein
LEVLDQGEVVMVETLAVLKLEREEVFSKQGD